MERPIIISIIALLAMIVGIFMLFGGITSAIISEAEFLKLNVDVTYEAFKTAGYIALVSGLLMFVVGFLLWTGKKIAWYLAVVVFIFEIVVAIYNIITTGQYTVVVSIVIAAIVLFYLFTPKVKAFYSVG